MKVYDIDEKLKDYTFLDWTERRVSSGTSGSLLKARENKNGLTYFYKLSSFDPYRGIYGSECVNELVASRLMNLLGIGHLQYRLIHATVRINGKDYETWMCKSQDFRTDGEKKTALDTYYEMNRTQDESPYVFCRRMGWETYLNKMFLIDYLIVNRDRHGANMEVLRSREKGIRLAPLFDNGLSFLAPFADREDRIRAFDPMDDVYVNNFIGSRSLFENLDLMSSLPEVDTLQETAKDEIFKGLDGILPDYHLEKMWQIIQQRWRFYEKFCDKK